MSHWAELDENNIVLQVLVCDNDDPNGDEGYQWLIDNFGGTWMKTSFNGNIRKNFAGIGFSYDPIRDAFIPPKPFDSAVFNDETCKWDFPPMPAGDSAMAWDFDLNEWVEFASPHPSWTVDETRTAYLAPVPYPRDGFIHEWDEASLTWNKTDREIPSDPASLEILKQQPIE